jgi:hypothetical protein
MLKIISVVLNTIWLLATWNSMAADNFQSWIAAIVSARISFVI